MSGPVEFLPEEIVRILLEHDVEFVVIGGLAAQAHGSAMLTQDIDITPEMSLENLARVSRALTALNARIRHPQISEGLPFGHDAASLSAAIFWNLITDFGEMDLSFYPAGTEGFPDLMRSAVMVSFNGQSMPVASLADIIRSKDAANRDKDRRVLPLLRRLLDDQETRG